MEKPTFHRYSRFEGFENESIKSLQNQIEFLRESIKISENIIYDIQSNCAHNYMYSSSGMFEDNYICKHCGHEIEH